MVREVMANLVKSRDHSSDLGMVLMPLLTMQRRVQDWLMIKSMQWLETAHAPSRADLDLSRLEWKVKVDRLILVLI